MFQLPMLLICNGNQGNDFDKLFQGEFFRMVFLCFNFFLYINETVNIA